MGRAANQFAWQHTRLFYVDDAKYNDKTTEVSLPSGLDEAYRERVLLSLR